MTRRKKSGDSPALPRSGVAGLLEAVPSELLIGVAVLVVLALGGYYGWRKWGVPVTQQARHRVSLERLEVTPLPPWIHSDVKAEAARDASLSDLSLFDKDLTVRVYQAFEMHAWVEKVNRVSKGPSATIQVDLEYRRPVAWVEVPPGVLPNNEVGLLPVDGSGVLLPPADFGSEQADDYVRVHVENLTPCGLPGTAWGDPRVAAAAQIASLLAEHSRALGLHRILVSYGESHQQSTSAILYEVRTRRGLRFIWGSPPGSEGPGEPKASLKAARLLQIAAAPSPGSIGAIQEFDLRKADAGLPKQRTARAAETPSY